MKREDRELVEAIEQEGAFFSQLVLPIVFVLLLAALVVMGLM